MSIKFTCDDKATLIAYLYGDIDPVARQAVDDHVAGCAACSAEVTALGHVRSELGLWAPPEAELDFQIVKKSQSQPATVLRPARWWNTVPGWTQAAAAVLVMAAGLSIANLQIKSGPDGFTVSTGWLTTASPAANQPADGTAAEQRFERALVSLEQQLRTEIRAAREQAAPVASRAAVDEATIRRVQQLINEAEQRHERALAARFVEFTRDVNLQRRADLMNISRVVGSYDEQLMRQRQMLNNVIRVSNNQQ
ncbi:MAG TPA: zf-HC2 domain-containing protein [Vicinamibacterales bacterium]|nr:zf-HC2 domain-containing protein [Vicinamibacterales bacterium]